jgi:hypothetical protein
MNAYHAKNNNVNLNNTFIIYPHHCFLTHCETPTNVCIIFEQLSTIYNVFDP